MRSLGERPALVRVDVHGWARPWIAWWGGLLRTLVDTGAGVGGERCLTAPGFPWSASAQVVAVISVNN
jgi:hypothetical protein